MVLLIDQNDINQIELTPRDVIDVVESAYMQDGKGLAEETPRLEIQIKGKHLPHIAPGTTSVGQGMAYLEESKVFILSYTFHFDFHKYISQILDPETGKRRRYTRRIEGTKSVADKALRAELTRVDKDKAPRQKRLTFGAMLDDHLDNWCQRVSARTLHDYRKAVERYLPHNLRRRRLDKLTPVVSRRCFLRPHRVIRSVSVRGV